MTATTSFDTAFAAVLDVEGGFSNDPGDPGNWSGAAVGRGHCGGTKYGISQSSFPTLVITDLTVDEAKAIYRTFYWSHISGDDLPPGVALLVFDGAVNQGVRTSSRILQAACGTPQDGVVGPLTVASTNAHDPHLLMMEIASRRAVAYAGDQAAYQLGWYRRLMGMMVLAVSL